MLLVGVLVASVVVPYVLLDKNLSQTAQAQLNRLLGKGESASGENPLADFVCRAEGRAAAGLASPATARPAAAGAGGGFRFDATPQWVTSRWPRVSTVPGEPNWLGMRVPSPPARNRTMWPVRHLLLRRSSSAADHFLWRDWRRAAAAGFWSTPTN
jgi:hypothetical protein